jgi:hypothetical protein
MQSIAADKPYAQVQNRMDVFLTNPNGHAKFYLGEAKRIGNSTIMLGLAALCVLILIVIAGLIVSENLRLQNLINNGETARGEIVDYETRSGRRGGTSYYITYEYRVNGVEYRNDQQISSEHFRSVQLGDRIEVIYDPASPSTAILGGEDLDMTSTNNSRVAGIIIGIAMLVFAVLLVWVDQRNRTFSEKGQLLYGNLVTVSGKNGSKGAYNVTIEYVFNTPEGRQLKKKTTFNRPDLRKTGLPPSGKPVALLYINDKQVRLL